MTTVENNKIIHTIKKGVGSSIVIKGMDWTAFDEIKCHVKSVNKIDARPMLELTPEIDGEHLVIPISGEETLLLNSHRTYFDIKLIIEDKVIEPVIPGEIVINETVTKPWN